MKETTLKVGNKVRVLDGSWGLRLDEFEEHPCLGLMKSHTFEVLDIISRPIHMRLPFREEKVPVHDIHIKDLVTGARYLHTSRFVERLPRCCPTCGKEV